MSSRVMQYSLQNTQDPQVISMPVGATFISIGTQDLQMFMYFEIDDAEDQFENRTFMIVGTAWELPPFRKYIGSVISNQFAMHVYEFQRGRE